MIVYESIRSVLREHLLVEGPDFSKMSKKELMEGKSDE